MRVYIHSGGERFIYRSGVGRAKELQRRALNREDVSVRDGSPWQCDVIHINTAGPGGYRLELGAKRKGVPVVVSAHNIAEILSGTYRVGDSRRVVEAYRKWLSLVYCRADVVIAPTEYVRGVLRSKAYGVEVPIVVASNGVDVGEFGCGGDPRHVESALSAINLGLLGKNVVDANSRIVLSVGMQSERKGLVEFVELAKRSPEYEFVWVGRTASVAQTSTVRKALSKAAGIPNVHFPGYVDHRLLPAFYALASVFLFLTREETEGLVVLEALASKAPVVVSDIPVYGDWLQDGRNCYKVPPYSSVEKGDLDPEEYYYRIVARLHDAITGSDSVVEAGFRTACERDVARIGSKLVGVYRHAIDAVRLR